MKVVLEKNVKSYTGLLILRMMKLSIDRYNESHTESNSDKTTWISVTGDEKSRSEYLCLTGKIEGTCARGRQKLTYLDSV